MKKKKGFILCIVFVRKQESFVIQSDSQTS